MPGRKPNQRTGLRGPQNVKPKYGRAELAKPAKPRNNKPVKEQRSGALGRIIGGASDAVRGAASKISLGMPNVGHGPRKLSYGPPTRSVRGDMPKGKNHPTGRELDSKVTTVTPAPNGRRGARVETKYTYTASNDARGRASVRGHNRVVESVRYGDKPGETAPRVVYEKISVGRTPGNRAVRRRNMKGGR